MSAAIPPITHPMGKYWEQPPVESILVDETHALMDIKTFDALHDYSATIPTGAYPGKMWKRHDGAYDPRCHPAKRTWMLMWYGDHKDPEKVSINHRKILIA